MIKHPVYTVSYNDILYRVFRRTFEAAKYDKGTEERNRLNEEAYSSEYMTSFKYLLIYDLPETEDRLAHTREKSYRTKQEAIEDINYMIKYNK